MTTQAIRGMITSELNRGIDYASKLLAMRDLLPRDLAAKLGTWHGDLLAEQEDRALIDQRSRNAAAVEQSLRAARETMADATRPTPPGVAG